MHALTRVILWSQSLIVPLGYFYNTTEFIMKYSNFRVLFEVRLYPICHLLIIVNQIICIKNFRITVSEIGCSVCLRLMRADPAVHADIDTKSEC